MPNSARRKWRSVADKADALIKLIHSFDWTLGEMLHIIFGTKDPLKDESFTPSLTHVQMLSKFLKGQTRVSIGSVLDLFMSSKYGIPPTHDHERDLFFSLSTNYHAIHYARPAITSFAAQLVEAELIKAASRTVRKDGGLHTFTSARGANTIEASVNQGAESFSIASRIFRDKMPLAWDLFFSMANPSQQENSRDRRPPELVVTHALSCLAYSRNLYAKLVPLEKSLLNFACCANHYIYKYDSHVGIGSSYHSTYEAMSKSTIDVLNIKPAIRTLLKKKRAGFEIKRVEKLLGFLACEQRGRRTHENGVSGHSSVNQRN